MSKCARPGCQTPANSSCSGCAREQYCSTSCQNVDWKIHKSMCSILKKLSNQFLPFREAYKIIIDILNSEKGSDRRILEHLLSYAEYQFGKEVTGSVYHKKRGAYISDWDLDIFILHNINERIANFYGQSKSLSTMIRDEMRLPYLERSLSLLNPYLIHLDSDVFNNRINGFDNNHIDALLRGLIFTEGNMASLTMARRQYDIAEGHCQRYLAYSRRYTLEGEEKTTFIFEALRTYCTFRDCQGDDSGAVLFAEEAYNFVVEAYDPVHPQVQEAAGTLIHILIKKGDLYDAERYAQATYSNLRDKKNGMDQESEEIATCAYNSANVIFKQNGDLIKAEELAREALRIQTLIFGSDNNDLGISCDLLARILRAQSRLGDETRELSERALAIYAKNHGPDGLNTACGNDNVGDFYYELAEMQPTIDSKRTQLLLAKSHFEEALRIYLMLYDPTHPNTIYTTSRLADIVRELSEL
jgi:tetratricopeptide (TPR) repeat protein